MPLRAEQLDGGLALGVGAQHVGEQRRPVRPGLAGADRGALADAGVGDEPVEAAELAGQRGHDLVDGGGVVDVECGGDHPDAGVRGEQLVAERVQEVDPPRHEGEVAAAGGEPAGHALAEAGARAGDQDALTGRVRHRAPS